MRRRSSGHSKWPISGAPRPSARQPGWWRIAPARAAPCAAVAKANAHGSDMQYSGAGAGATHLHSAQFGREHARARGASTPPCRDAVHGYPCHSGCRFLCTRDNCWRARRVCALSVACVTRATRRRARAERRAGRRHVYLTDQRVCTPHTLPADAGGTFTSSHVAAGAPARWNTRYWVHGASFQSRHGPILPPPRSPPPRRRRVPRSRMEHFVPLWSSVCNGDARGCVVRENDQH